MRTETREERLQSIYHMAQAYLLDNLPAEVPKADYRCYFNIEKTYTTKNEILYGLLVSLQNKRMANKVINITSPKRKDIFKDILCNYDSKKILATYSTDDLLFERFDKAFVINNKNSAGNMWRRYSKSVLSACILIDRFESSEDFTQFANRFSYNELSSSALPLVLSHEVYGLGFPLACDWLKDLGFSEYPKPDVHIKDIFAALGLCEHDDYSAYKAVIEMARAVHDTPFNVDRTFWLIGSGDFYLHDKRIGRLKGEFIQLVTESD